MFSSTIGGKNKSHRIILNDGFLGGGGTLMRSVSETLSCLISQL